ncbi:uncharacterized protein LOC135244955 [Anguilla rostrata]|uniref:uncharacterized protein LOC135244955 n=1 Tax=Anguilla rostrata TaxID=7938 RepID=UPI0030CD053C
MELRKPAARTCSLGDNVTRSHTYHSVTTRSEEMPEEEGSPRQRRITVASYIPQTKDRNGNFAGKANYGDSGRHSGGDRAKPLVELDTEGVCRWFASIGLQKCLPFIRGANLCGSHIATVDPNILEVLHVSALEERELLLSAIYKELHPPDSTTEKLDTLLESIGPHNVEKFTAALVSMSKSKSSPHVNCVSSSRSSFKFRDRSRLSTIQRSSHLVEITIHALEQIVHLRTPKDTTVGKVMESCLKTLGVTDSRELFSLRSKLGPLAELSFDQQIGDLLGSEKRLLELNLFKKGNHRTKEEKIRELNQHVDSLQNVIHQVQELHQSLVSFCGELRNMESEPSPDAAGPSEVEAQLELVQSRLQERQQSVQAAQDRLSSLETRKDRRPEVHLLDKMKLDCQIFKEEITIIHLNRQVARLKTTLQEFQAKEQPKRQSLTLGQLVSPQCPAVLLMTQETRRADGGYGFTARFSQEAGLVVVTAQNTQLCVHDRLVEVNGVSVLESGEDELSDLLFRRPSARIVVLRKPPPLPPKPGRVPEPVHTQPQGDHPPTTTPPHRQVLAT